MEECVNECVRYSTEYDKIYLFPVFEEVAKKYGLTFSVKYNVVNVRRYFYAGLLKFAQYYLKTKGVDKYKESLKVKYDGF